MAAAPAQSRLVPTTDRFADFTEEELVKILNTKDSENTKKVDKHSVSVLETFIASKHIDVINEGQHCHWTELDKTNLAKLLRKFYAEVRDKSGQLYKKTTLLSIRNGVNRHLNNIRRERDQTPINLTADTAFAEANDMLRAMKKVLKENDKASIRHHPAIESACLTKLRQYFKENVRTDARILQQAVFVNIMIYHGRRGRENLRTLKITDFAVTSDAENNLYVYKVTDERTENHQDDDKCKEARMYQDQDDDECCPVKLFVFYKKRLNPDCIFLFQRPKRKVDTKEKVWYDNCPVGQKTLGDMMSTISKYANLSKRYTNHSLRATTVTLLDDAGQEGRHIIAVTQHASTSSLNSYTRTSEKRKQQMSNILSYGLSGNDTSSLSLHNSSTSSLDHRSSTKSLNNLNHNSNTMSLINLNLDDNSNSRCLLTFAC